MVINRLFARTNDLLLFHCRRTLALSALEKDREKKSYYYTTKMVGGREILFF